MKQQIRTLFSLLGLLETLTRNRTNKYSSNLSHKAPLTSDPTKLFNTLFIS